MDFRFRGKSGNATDITGMTEFDPKRHSMDLRISPRFWSS
jgi:hypothetical protein